MGGVVLCAVCCVLCRAWLLFFCPTSSVCSALLFSLTHSLTHSITTRHDTNHKPQTTKNKQVKALRRLRGHSSYVNHIDWSLDSRLLQSTCGAYELLYWDVAKGGQLLSSADTLEGDTRWASRTVTLGFGVMGIWPPNAKGTDINAVDVDEALGLCVTSDDCGRLSLFNYPCIVADAPSKVSP